MSGYARTARGDGYVLFLGDDMLAAALPWRSLVFARQSLRLFGELQGLNPRDRITPILDTIAATAPPWPSGTLLLEHPDSAAGKPLSVLARSYGKPRSPA